MKLIISLAVILSSIAAASALQCYVCNSHRDTACGDLFQAESPALKKFFLKDCRPDASGREPFCRKTKTLLELTGEIRIHRDCGYQIREGRDCYQQRAEVYLSEVCQCHDNYCNSAPTHVITLVSLLVPFALAAAIL